MKLALVAALCAACGSNGGASTPHKLVFERWSSPQPTSHDVFLAARGDIVVMAHRVSRDAGATWQPLATELGVPARVAITNGVIATYASGLVRWDLASNAVTVAAGAPSFITDRSWRVDPISGRFIGFDAVENKLAVEGANGWTASTLPLPSTTEPRPYIKDIESNGGVLLSISAWGVHRSVDGTSWQLVTTNLPNAGRDLLVLGDRRFALVGGATTYVFDPDGQSAGTLAGLVVDDSVGTVCEDGAIVAGNLVTRDFGATWQTLLKGGDLQMMVQRAGCGGGRYWGLMLSDAWGYRLVRYDVLGGPGIVAGNWGAIGDQAWNPSGPPIVRTQDGTFIVAGLALAPGSTTWTLQEMPARTWASGTTLFGVAKQKFYASYDNGVTWTAAAAQGLGTMEPEAFAQGPDGALHVGQFTGIKDGAIATWHSQVWKSSDGGASWTVAYDAIATRGEDDKLVGETHRFVGVLADGAWISTDAVSHDAGATWKATDVKGDRGLAHLTRNGSLVTGGADEDLWRVYGDGGLGELTSTWSIVVDDKPIPAAQLRTVVFDDMGYAYTARGTPNVQIWRSNQPVD
ncbi:MAG TPA: sialidase family protein [Kofleriaceae bacterium]